MRPFEQACFIKPNRAFDPSPSGLNLAPMFRKTFFIEESGTARLSVCGLGFAYYYINGTPVSPDLFTAPVSQYDKTLWYLVYDVSALIKPGKNTIAVICGNGWLNESFPSSWNLNEATYRDHPKFILELSVNGQVVLASDDSWKCLPENAYRYNELRSGEYFDATLYDPSWTTPGFADEGWESAVRDDRPPKGVFRKCECEPIREIEVLNPERILPGKNGKWVFDLGRNIAGYIRLNASGTAGQLLTIRYAERREAGGDLDVAGIERFYPESEFQTDRFVCSGNPTVWSPKFVYHGFRFIEIEGLREPDEVSVQGVFVHQVVREKTTFSCSSTVLNQLFSAARASSLSNLFYLISDCPTREKLGWMNDAQMSAEQLLTNYHTERLMKKWLFDMYDAMREDGSLPGIVPTPGWGYTWGNGPLSDGAMFEIPYRIYRLTGDPEPLVRTLPRMERYLNYLKSGEDANGDISFGLGDWASAGNQSDIPVPFVNSVLQYKFYKIASLASRLAKNETASGVFQFAATSCKRRLFRKYLLRDGSCSIDEQSAVAMLIEHGLYRRLSPLKIQLKQLVEKERFHHHCGQLGIRCLFEALNRCGLQEYALRILTAKGYPGYLLWMEREPSTLWEHWRISLPGGAYNSSNHHMNGSFSAWMIHTILGIRPDGNGPDPRSVSVAPYFFKSLTSAEGSYQNEFGSVCVNWKQSGKTVLVTITVTGEMTAVYRGKSLREGTYFFSRRQKDS